MTSIAELATIVRSVASEMPLERYFTAGQLQEAAAILQMLAASIVESDLEATTQLAAESSNAGEDSGVITDRPDSLLFHTYIRPGLRLKQAACAEENEHHYGENVVIFRMEDSPYKF